MANEYKIAIVMVAEDKASRILKGLAEKAGGAAATLLKVGGTAAAGLAVANKGIETAFATYDGVMSSGIVRAGQMVHELAQFGAQSLRTERAFEAIAGGADAAQDRLTAMERATRGAMSQTEMMGQASRLMQMGLANTTGELEQITEMATRLGSAMGLGATASIEQFSLTLANTSIPRLDAFGISAGKVRTKIADLQVANADMTREEAFMIATMEEGQAALGRLGDAVDDEALAFERLEAQMANTKVELAQKVAPVWADFLGLMNTGIEEAGQWGMRMKQFYGGIAAGTLHIVGQDDAAVDLLQDMGLLATETDKAARANDAYSERLAGMASETYDLAAAADAADDPMEGLATAVGKVAGSFGEMEFDNESLWELALASGASLEQLGPLAEQLGIASDAEIQATLKAYELVEGFGAGALSAKDYRAEMAKTASDLQDLEHYAALAAGKMAAALGAGVRGPHEGPSATRRQHGGPASGLTLVGEGGPEALYMPPGSYVHSNQSTTTQNFMDQRTYNRTNNIGTELALALEANQAQQEQRSRANMIM